MPTTEHPASAPAPWINTGETYWFFLSTPTTPPEGAYAPLERDAFYASPEAGTFRGGLGAAMVQVVRYTETPAGPYDELIYMPGAFDTPSGNKALRVTRIYVSTDESTYNGRKNWNIPKHVARFSFTPLHPDSLDKSPIKIEVFPPKPADAAPFFAAIATPSNWLPSFPLNMKYLPMNFHMVHPPLPAEGPNTYSLVGTDQWISILPNVRGSAEVVWYTPGGGGEGIKVGEYADGVGFPKFIPWSMGLHLRNIILDFPEGDVVDDKKTK